MAKPKNKGLTGNQRKGIIMWNGSGCQTCFAVLDLKSKFRLVPNETVNATLKLRMEGSHHILLIEETK